jgi:hypothetical protein
MPLPKQKGTEPHFLQAFVAAGVLRQSGPFNARLNSSRPLDSDIPKMCLARIMMEKTVIKELAPNLTYRSASRSLPEMTAASIFLK